MAQRADIFVQIGQRLAQAVAEARMNQGDFARAMSVSDAQVSRWFQGINRIDIAQLRQAATVVDKPVWWLMGEEPPDPNSAFAHELHRLSPEDRDRAIEIIRSLRRTSEKARDAG